MENPEILIRRRHGKEQINTSQVESSFSHNQEEFHSFQDFDLETNFERSLLRSKSESDLKQAEINPDRLQSYFLDSLWHSLQDTIKTEESNPLIHTFEPHIPSLVQIHHGIPNPPRPMASIFSPLALPVVLHDLPQNYA